MAQAIHRTEGEEIPLAGRLMALADVYDALISKRPYEPAYPHQQAVKIRPGRRSYHAAPF